MRNKGAFIAIGGPMRCDDWPIQSDYLRAMLGHATGGKSTAGADIAICAAPRGVLLQHSRNSRDGIGVVRLEIRIRREDSQVRISAMVECRCGSVFIIAVPATESGSETVAVSTVCQQSEGAV